jgi:hypothetical protein
VELGVQSLCELPDSYEAYRKQQHRWHSGPMQLFRLALPDIIAAKVRMRSLVVLPWCAVRGRFDEVCLESWMVRWVVEWRGSGSVLRTGVGSVAMCRFRGRRSST